MGDRSKNYVFTVNNYTDADIAHLEELGKSDKITYLVWGKEVGESGTPHLQGFVQFSNRRSFNVAKNLIGRCNPHIEQSKSIKKAVEYCKKDGDFVEFGEMGSCSIQGSRSDIQVCLDAIKEGDITSKRQLMEQHSDVFAKYPRFCMEALETYREKVKPEAHALMEWQGQLWLDLEKPPSKRQVIFIVDVVGNAGKTWFSNYVWFLKDNVQILQPGRKADMAYAYNVDTRIFILDCARSKQDVFIQYDFLEQIKDGRLFSTKYESTTKIFTPPHVIVLMNEMPDETKLSRDRYDIRVVSRTL